MNTGVATLTLTPAGGVSNLPALVDGTPGLPPVITSITTVPVAYGTTPPASTFTLINPGGAGVASTYSFTLYVNSGQQGTAGTNATIHTASDFSGTLGSGTNGYTMYYQNSTGLFTLMAPKVPTGPYICQSSSFATAYSGSAGSYQIASIGTPSLPYAWRPIVQASFYATGTINTHVDGLVLLNSPVIGTGQQVGYGLGLTGVGPFVVTVQSSYSSTVAGSSTFGQVAAGTTANFYLIAAQLNSTTDAWQTVNTNGFFSITAVPT